MLMTVEDLQTCLRIVSLEAEQDRLRAQSAKEAAAQIRELSVGIERCSRRLIENHARRR